MIWSEASGGYEIIYEDARGSWVSWMQWRQESLPACSQWGAFCWKLLALNGVRLSNPGWDPEEVLSGVLKITKRAMIKRRSCLSLIPVSIRLSHTAETSTPYDRIKRLIYSFKGVLWSFFPHHGIQQFKL